jgi:hypothetical protein
MLPTAEGSISTSPRSLTVMQGIQVLFDTNNVMTPSPESAVHVHDAVAPAQHAPPRAPVRQPSKQIFIHAR